MKLSAIKCLLKVFHVCCYILCRSNDSKRNTTHLDREMHQCSNGKMAKRKKIKMMSKKKRIRKMNKREKTKMNTMMGLPNLERIAMRMGQTHVQSRSLLLSNRNARQTIRFLAQELRGRRTNKSHHFLYPFQLYIEWDFLDFFFFTFHTPFIFCYGKNENSFSIWLKCDVLKFIYFMLMFDVSTSTLLNLITMEFA